MAGRVDSATAMDEQDLEIIREFVLESNENLARLDQDIVDLESSPQDADLLASVFRTMHTLKGTCGFLGFSCMEGVAHHAENILGQLRSGKRLLDDHLTTMILQAVDVIRLELASVEATGAESGAVYPDLLERLQETATGVRTTAQDTRPALETSGPAPQTGGPAQNRAPTESTQHMPSAMDQAEIQPESTPQTTPQDPFAPRVAGLSATPVQPSSAKEETVRISPAKRKASVGGGEALPAPPKVINDTAIRVDVNLLDSLMNLVGELVLARNQIVQFISAQEDPALSASSQRLDLITSELQEGVMKTRMQPIGVIWNKLPRVVRDIASTVGKQIRLEMEGAETELDRTIIEAIKDPLTHIVRNSCDHGIEDPVTRVATGKPPQGKLEFRAFHEGGHVNIEIRDDGRGIDPDRVRRRAVERGLLTEEAASRIGDREALLLIFAPGFSTAETVSNLSGRGVGMDVVRTNIEKIGGSVEVSSVVGEGTNVRLKIPLTLAIIPGLVVTNADDRYVIPQVSLLELIRLEGEQVRNGIQRIHGIPVYRRRGTLLPLAFLSDLFPSPSAAETAPRRRATDPPQQTAAQASRTAEVLNIVVLQAESQQFGLVVDAIHDTQEIVVKPLSKQLKGLNCYAGATIMGDGKVALILDVPGLAQISGVLKRNAPHAETGGFDTGLPANTQSYLLFSCGRQERLAVPLDLVARLEEIPSAHLERAAGHLVVQYRGKILPIVPVAQLLHPEAEDPQIPELLRVVVFAEGSRSVGLLVDEILDIVEGDPSTLKPSRRPGILASFVLDGKVSDLLDLHHLLSQPHLGWFDEGPRPNEEPSTVLILEPQTFRRSLLRTALQVQGFLVRETASEEEAARILAEDGIQAVLVSQSLPAPERERLQQWIREQQPRSQWRVLALMEGLLPPSPEPPPEPYDGWTDLASAPEVVGSLLRLQRSLRPAAEPVEEMAGT